MASSSMGEFFGDSADNLTSITWAHAVNNQKYLAETLNNSNINMIEADITLGKVNGQGEDQPIMGHPPTNTSDLSLLDFLTKVNEFNKNSTQNKKGVKLDFKSTEVYTKSVDVVKNFTKGGFPIWLNADILKGPINSTTIPVDPKTFLEKAKQFPNSVLSLGWTTRYTSEGEKGNGSYSDSDVETMVQTLKSNNVNQNVTFAVRAGLAAESIDQMINLLDKVPNSTLTIWQSSEDDVVNFDNLNLLIANIGLNQTYIDVPADVMSKLNLTQKNQGIKNLIPSMLCLIGCLITVF